MSTFNCLIEVRAVKIGIYKLKSHCEKDLTLKKVFEKDIQELIDTLNSIIKEQK